MALKIAEQPIYKSKIRLKSNSRYSIKKENRQLNFFKKIKN